MDIEEAENRLFQLKQSMELLDLVTGKPIEEDTKLNIKAIETVLSELEKKDKEIKQLKSMELKAKHGIASITLEGLINLENGIKKKDKIINEMAKKLVEAHGWFYSEFDNFKEEDWIDYFTKKVEGK